MFLLPTGQISQYKLDKLPDLGSARRQHLTQIKAHPLLFLP